MILNKKFKMTLTDDFDDHREFDVFKLLKNDNKYYLKKYLGIINDKNKKKKKKNIINKGTGAGGSNTNKNGLPYEFLTDLNDSFTIIKTNKFSKNIMFNNYKKEFIRTEKSNLFKHMNRPADATRDGHGCIRPDECYIDEFNKNIFIIEKKFQQTNGSTCEKIQTPKFKIWQYSRTFPQYNIVYIYCLCEWFKTNCKAEIEYLDFMNIPYFWGNDDTYKENIINFIINYK